MIGIILLTACTETAPCPGQVTMYSGGMKLFATSESLNLSLFAQCQIHANLILVMTMLCVLETVY